jgi:adenylate cyclase
MRIAYVVDGRKTISESDKTQLVIGRPRPGLSVDLDLSPDKSVSRRHARLWVEKDKYWIEDLGSAGGTLVVGEDIRGKGPRSIAFQDEIRIGEATLRVEAVTKDEAAPETTERRAPALPNAVLPLDATIFAGAGAAACRDEQRLALLLELPLQFAQQSNIEDLLDTVVQRMVAVIPGATHCALLLGNTLLLKASYPPCGGAPSTTLARRAMKERKGFIWQRNDAEDLSRSITSGQIGMGMYAPLLWEGEALGVLCVHLARPDPTSTDDLRLLLTVAQYAAMAVASRQLQQQLQEKARLLDRLMTNFSPSIRAKLLEKAHHGRLRPGGERSEVTILFADIRGFTLAAAKSEAEDVLDMLNEYFPALAKPLFHYDGTIDKYVGDAILAVFGSPEPDEQRNENAVMAALEMQAAMAVVNRDRAARGVPAYNIGIGVHCGDVVHGFVGTSDMLQFTVIGDTVNRASRFCSGAAPGEVIISPQVYERVWRVVEVENTKIPTKHEGALAAYRVKGMREKAGASRAAG